MNTTKRCPKCGETKERTEFYKNRTTKDGLQGWCKPCLGKKVYEGQKEPGSHKARKTRTNREYVWEYLKGHPCEACGLLDPRVMEFDHLDGVVKLGNISTLIVTHSLEVVKTEIAKCQVLCANCHKLRTAEQLGYWWTKLDE